MHRNNPSAAAAAASGSFSGTCFSVTPAEVRITENPQYSKTSKLTDGYHAAPSAVLNTSLFDSSQRRLLDLTIDSNSVEQYDDDDDGDGDGDNATNCDQNDDSAAEHGGQTSQLTVRVVRQSSSEGDDNNNGAGRGPSLHNHHNTDCRHQLALRGHHHNHHDPVADIVQYDDDHEDEEEEDDDNLEELNNSSALLNESGLSSKPLHQQHASSWNFRRPIVGPNG